MGYDHTQGAVFLWAQDGRPIKTFGRFGKGPGEFAPPGALRVYPQPPVHWIDYLQDTAAVFDGNDIHLFTGDGTFISKFRSLPDAIRSVRPFSSRMRRYPGGVLVDIEGRVRLDRPPGPQTRVYRLWLLHPESATSVAAIELAPLPWSASTGSYHGVAEARPLWDRSKDCFVISDGATARLFMGRIGAPGLDTIEIPLPDVRPAPSSDESEVRERLGVRGEVPRPAMPRRVTQLVVDPAGWIWILPVQREDDPNGRVAVLRIAPVANYVARESTLLFPMAFGSPGTYLARRARDTMGTRNLVRVSNVP